jgi:hypothetical protein
MAYVAQLAQSHWNETPLFLTEEERYSIYPFLAPWFSSFFGNQGPKDLGS